jgi:CBS domain containing-hemolysin-like protein
MHPPLTLAVLGIACLVLLAGVFAASEASLLALSRLRILQRDGNGKTPQLVKLLDERNHYLTTILVGNTVVLLAAQSMATWAFIEYNAWRPVLSAALVMTIVLLVVGEIVPKMVVVQDASRWAPRFAAFLQVVYVVLRPVTWTVVGFTSWLIRLFGGDPAKAGPYVTEDDIRTLVNVGEKQGVLEEEEKEMIHSIFEFGDTVAREVMTPRTDIVSADASEPVSKGVEIVARDGYSKLPVFDGNIDHVVGVVHDRELLVYVSRGELTRPLRNLMRPIKAVPENKKIDELLREMQAERVSVAIVVDEYGGTAGLVTMEDLLEEIVGEIMDEYDATEHDRPPEIIPAGENQYVVDARMNIDDVNERLGLRLPTEDFESIGGYTFGLFGRVPTPGEHVVIDSGVILVVEKTAGRRLLSVRIKNAPGPEGAGESIAAEMPAEQ